MEAQALAKARKAWECSQCVEMARRTIGLRTAGGTECEGAVQSVQSVQWKQLERACQTAVSFPSKSQCTNARLTQSSQPLQVQRHKGLPTTMSSLGESNEQ